MDIRINKKEYPRYKKLYDRSILNKDMVTITEDEKAAVPVIAVKTEDGQLAEWTSGKKNVLSFIKNGFVEIKRDCPFRRRTCNPKKCGFYVVKDGTGDCMIAWLAVQAGIIR